MRKLFTILLVLLSFGAAAQEIKWMSMDEALAAQKTNPKPIFVDVYTHWCGPCKTLEKQTFKDLEVVRYINKNFYAVKFNAEGNTSVTFQGKKYGNPHYVEGRKGRNAVHEFTLKMQVAAYPTMVIIDKSGGMKRIKGFHEPASLLEILKNRRI